MDGMGLKSGKTTELQGPVRCLNPQAAGHHGGMSKPAGPDHTLPRSSSLADLLGTGGAALATSVYKGTRRVTALVTSFRFYETLC